MAAKHTRLSINLQMHVAKKRFVSQGIKLSAEVKPFVPKHAAVTVAWSEPSEACVFPRYLTTCYPFVQEPSLDKYVYFLNLISWGILIFQFWTLNTLTKSRFQYIVSPTVEMLLHYLCDLVFYIYVPWAYTRCLIFCLYFYRALRRIWWSVMIGRLFVCFGRS